MRARLTLIAVVLVGCSTLDVAQPIDLVPGADWQPWEIQLLGSAARCWNLRYATRLQVTQSPRSVQQVGVSYSDFICLYARGVTEPNLPVRVYLCPSRYASGDRSVQERILFVLALHELGHVLNIRYHSDDPNAVMAAGDVEGNVYMPVPAGFTDEDSRLFREVNPGFDPSPPGCSPVAIDTFPFGCACGR